MMNWVIIDENNFDTYPNEGICVIVSDDVNYDVAWYLMSSEYKWMKNDLVNDDCYEFKQFKILKWSYID